MPRDIDMQLPFAFANTSGSSELYKSELFAWVLFGISVVTVIIFLVFSWSFFHWLRITFPAVGILALHPRLWLDAYHGDGGIDLRTGSILFSALITVYVVAAGSILLHKNLTKK